MSDGTKEDLGLLRNPADPGAGGYESVEGRNA